MKRYTVRTEEIEWQGMGPTPSKALQFIVSVDGIEKHWLDEEDDGVTSKEQAIAVARQLEGE